MAIAGGRSPDSVKGRQADEGASPTTPARRFPGAVQVRVLAAVFSPALDRHVSAGRSTVSSDRPPGHLRGRI